MKGVLNLATQKEVAILADVSSITVSRVINNKGNIKEETRKRVLAAIEKLNYHPNSLARGLNQSRIFSIGVASSIENPNVHFESHPYFNGLLEGIEQALMEHSYDLVISTRRGKKQVSDYYRLYYEKKVDGIILICTSLREDSVNEMLAFDIPCVVIGDRTQNNKIPYVDSDNVQGGKDVTKKLIQYGHRKIAFVGGIEKNNNVEDRQKGFLEIMHENNLKVPSEYLFTAELNNEEESSHQVMRTINLMNNPPTAVIAATDMIALGMIREATNIGIKIPDQISVIGFDATTTGRYFTPALFSVRQPLFTMGYTAAKQLLKIIEKRDVIVASHVFPVVLVPGESVVPVIPILDN